MIVSMTGFGKSGAMLADKTIKAEIRTLNSKNLDLTIKLPSIYRERENTIRGMLGNLLERGKVELIVTLECSDNNASYAINTPLLLHYFKEMKKAARQVEIDLSDNFFPDLLRLPEVLKPQTDEPDAEEWTALEKAVNDAIAQVIQFRQSEGKHLFEDILAREDKLRTLLVDIEPFEKVRIHNIRERIIRSLKDISEDVRIDQNRFEQEVIFYLEKLDITEEKVRLHKHLDYFNETLNSSGAGGKKLGFIAQEIGREINTIGSKANDASMQKVVVQMKDELEKIKEQLMNVL
ncbi:MAG: YicC family protein [Bacteroidetes bacterium]|nr:MAG: YicC family protein [Bacteroidota bacterium]